MERTRADGRATRRRYAPDVEFSPEDAGRTEPEFLYEVLEAAIEAGATTLNIPDTVGYTMPDEFGALIAGIMKNVPGIENVVVSVHCHNDLGLATANTLAGIRAGARQAEVTINGIGERAGNTSLEEVVMALHTRQPLFGLRTGIDTTQLVRTSASWSRRAPAWSCSRTRRSSAPTRSPTRPASTRTACSSTKRPTRSCGPRRSAPRKTLLVLGKHSGRHAFAVRLDELGHPLEGEALEAAFARFKVLADKKKRITDADLEALATAEIGRGPRVLRARRAAGRLRHRAACRPRPCGCAAPTARSAPRPRSAPGRWTRRSRRSTRSSRRRRSCSSSRCSAVTEGIDALGDASVRVRAARRRRGRVNPQHGTAPGADLPRPRRRHRHDRREHQGLPGRAESTARRERSARNPTGRHAGPEPRSQLAGSQPRPRRMTPEPSDAQDAVREDLGRARRRRGAGAPGGRSTSTCTWSTRSPRRRRSPGSARAGSRCAARTAPSRRWITPCRRCPSTCAWSIREAQAQLATLEKNCAEYGIPLYALGNDKQGIVHVIGPELGLTQPGMTIVCGDSHTSTHGAFGALAFGIGTSEVEHVLATQCLLQRKPKTLEVRVDGRLGAGRHRQGHHPGADRPDRHRRRHRPRDRVHRQRDPRARHGSAHDDLQHVHRGRRARGHDRARRRARSVPGRPRVRAAGRRLGRGGRALEASCRPTTARATTAR